MQRTPFQEAYYPRCCCTLRRQKCRPFPGCTFWFGATVRRWIHKCENRPNMPMHRSFVPCFRNYTCAQWESVQTANNLCIHLARCGCRNIPDASLSRSNIGPVCGMDRWRMRCRWVSAGTIFRINWSDPREPLERGVDGWAVSILLS